MRIHSQQGVHEAAFAFAPGMKWRKASDTDEIADGQDEVPILEECIL